MTNTPEQQLLAAFWKCLRNDLQGNGCTSDNLKLEQRRLPYDERVIIERDILKIAAHTFLSSSDFDWWSVQSGIDVDYMRMRFHAVSNL